MMDDEEPIEYPINGTLDLHVFRPSEVKDIVLEYIEACLEKEIYSLRIIHGKGKGVLRTQVHAILERHPQVSAFEIAGSDAGHWGATLVKLTPPS